MKLPFTFLSGHIHELRIHVPWTKLGSEPVVITINTMECILKLKDGIQDDHDSCGSNSTVRSTSENTKSSVKPRKIQQAAPTDPVLPPDSHLRREFETFYHGSAVANVYQNNATWDCSLLR